MQAGAQGARAAAAMIYSFYIYNRDGVCLYYREWSRPKKVSNLMQDQKLMFGFLFSLKQLVLKMSPKQ